MLYLSEKNLDTCFLTFVKGEVYRVSNTAIHVRGNSPARAWYCNPLRLSEPKEGEDMADLNPPDQSGLPK